MSINKNLSDMMPKESNFEILDHFDVNDIDDLVKKDIIVFFLPNNCKENDIEIIITLTEQLNNAFYDVRNVFSIDELFSIINKNISRINFVFIFTPLLSEAWKIEKTNTNIYMIFKSLQDFNINIYPSAKLNYIFESQIYLKMLHDHYPQFSLPQSQFVFYPIWNNILYEEYEEKILSSLDNLKDIGHQMAVIKKSFSPEKQSNRYIKLEESTEIKKKLIKSMDFIESGNSVNNIGKYDNHGFKLGIIQPYMKPNVGLVHSVWFIDGVMADFYYCDNKKGICHYDNTFLNELKKFCNDLFKTFIKDICKNIPSIIKIDVGISTKKLMQDKYSLEIDDKKMRFYVNNISVDNHDLLSCSSSEDTTNQDINTFINNNKNNLCKSLLIEMCKKSSSKKLIDIVKRL